VRQHRLFPARRAARFSGEAKYRAGITCAHKKAPSGAVALSLILFEPDYVLCSDLSDTRLLSFPYKPIKLNEVKAAIMQMRM